MRPMRPIVFALGLASAVASGFQPLSDAQIEKLLVGRWKHEQSDDNAVTEYRDDGTFVGTGSVDRIEGTVKIRVSGRWKVSDGEVIEVVEKCEPAGIPPGTTLYDRVLELNTNTFRYRTERGIETTKTRLNN